MLCSSVSRFSFDLGYSPISPAEGTSLGTLELSCSFPSVWDKHTSSLPILAGQQDLKPGRELTSGDSAEAHWRQGYARGPAEPQGTIETLSLAKIPWYSGAKVFKKGANAALTCCIAISMVTWHLYSHAATGPLSQMHVWLFYAFQYTQVVYSKSKLQITFIIISYQFKRSKKILLWTAEMCFRHGE